MTPGHKWYKKAKFQSVAKFSEIEAILFSNNRSLKKKTRMMSNLCRYKPTDQVLDVYRNLKERVPPEVYDALLAVGIKVYAEELNDPTVSLHLVDQMLDPMSKIQAHCELGNFHQAYAVAASIHSMRAIRLVQKNAQAAGSRHVVELCQGYIRAATSGPTSVSVFQVGKDDSDETEQD